MTTVVAAIIVRNSRVLICQRRRDKAFPLKWEFPGGKVEADESLTHALKREIWEELGVGIELFREVYRTNYRYAELSAAIDLVFYSAKLVDENPARELSDEDVGAELAAFNASSAFEKVIWAEARELPSYEFLTANAELIARIASGGISFPLSQHR